MRAWEYSLEKHPTCVLIVDDEDSIVHALSDLLASKGCRALTAWSAESALELVKGEEPAAALLDIVLPGMNGLKLAGKLKSQWPQCEVLMITGQSSVDSVVEAIQQGASDYLAKPFDSLEEVWNKVEKALEKRAFRARRRELLDQA